MGANIEHAARPAEVVASRVVEARKSRGWKQTDLAQELARLGYPKSRSTITKLEGGQYRNVTVDDLFAFAAALGVAPVHLLTPQDDEVPVAITAKVQLPAVIARRWIRGLETPPMLPDVDFRQIPESELAAMVKRWLTRGMTPVAYALAAESLTARATEIAHELRNPLKEGENDGERG
jgi:transcriptional regulator with XRE-family HTH domain